VINMILKVEPLQPIFDHHKRDLRKSKEGLITKNSTSFASVLEKIIKSQPNGKQITC